MPAYTYTSTQTEEAALTYMREQVVNPQRVANNLPPFLTNRDYVQSVFASSLQPLLSNFSQYDAQQVSTAFKAAPEGQKAAVRAALGL